MATEKRSRAVLPHKREEPAPEFVHKPSDKYNVKVYDDSYVTVPVDDKGIPVQVVLPKKTKGK